MKAGVLPSNREQVDVGLRLPGRQGHELPGQTGGRDTGGRGRVRTCDRSGVRRADDTSPSLYQQQQPHAWHQRASESTPSDRISCHTTCHAPSDHLCRRTVERGAPSTSPTASRRRPTAARRRAVLRPDRWRLHRHGHRVVATTARSRGPAGATSGLRAANCGCPSRPCPAGCSSWCAIRGNTAPLKPVDPVNATTYGRAALRHATDRLAGVLWKALGTPRTRSRGAWASSSRPAPSTRTRSPQA